MIVYIVVGGYHDNCSDRICGVFLSEQKANNTVKELEEERRANKSPHWFDPDYWNVEAHEVTE
jgi:hypothetical protein